MNARSRARGAVAAGLDRVAHAVARRTRSAAAPAIDCDLLIADLLRRNEDPLEDPAAWTGFLRQAFAPQRHDVVELRRPEAESDERSLRFATLLAQLAAGVPPLPVATAVELARASDRLRGRREAFVRPAYAADVGHHSAMASSNGHQARLLAAVVRLAAARRIIEIGTAYGIGALNLAHAAGADARIVTAERSEPQLGLARELLRDTPTVTVVGQIATDAAGEITGLLGDAADMLFHDGAHSRHAYIEDFGAFAPLLGPGAIVVFDDIDWADERFHADADTYGGWRAVAGHERVRAAAEIDGTWGILLLR